MTAAKKNMSICTRQSLPRGGAKNDVTLDRPTDQMSAAEVTRALGVATECYKDLYACVETILDESNLISCTYRARTQRLLGFRAAMKGFVSSPMAQTVFPSAVEAVESGPQGQQALRRLVYIICGNYRRRNATKRHRSEKSPSPITPNHVVPGTNNDGTEKKAHVDLPEARWSGFRDSIYDEEISIRRGKGRIKSLCRLRNVISNSGHESKHLDDLDWEAFIRILQKENGMDNDTEYLTWANEDGEPQGSIDNGMQWKAAVAGQMARVGTLSFVIVKRSSLTAQWHAAGY